MNHHTYISIHKKYENPILPNIPTLILTYLFQHPEKKSLYLNPNITISDLLKSLNLKDNLLSQIIAFVERGAPMNQKSTILLN